MTNDGREEKPSKKKKPNIHEGHRERMRTKFVNGGADSFSDHEALELLLYYSIPRQNTNPLAHMCLQKYSSIENLFDADLKDLVKTLSVTENTAVLIKLVPYLAKKYLLGKYQNRPVLNNLSDAAEYCISLYRGIIYETFYVICLDLSQRLVAADKVTEGSINEAHVYPRKVIESALRFSASSVILAHNHPGGTLAASFSDIELTLKISQVMDMIGIKVSDHIIVCGDKYFSFKKEKLL